MGHAVPHKIGRHVHHKARPDDTAPPPAPTGIDYLRLVEAKHTRELADRLRYAHLPDQPLAGRLPDRPLPGQLLLPGINDNQTSDEAPA
jgi:putative transposase